MRALPLLLAGILALPAHAGTHQFANIVYDLPEGWTTSGRDLDRLELRYDGENCGSCRILIDIGAKADGPLSAWLANKARPEEGVTVIGEPEQRKESIGEFPVIALVRQVDHDGTDRLQAFTAIALPARRELLMFEGDAVDQDSFDRSLAMLNGDVLSLLNGLRFVSEGAAPVLGSPEPGELSGPWFGTALRNQYNGLSGTLDLVIDREAVTFYPDGRFFDGISPTGATSPDVPALVAGGEMRLGNYVVNGKDIELRYASGDISHLKLLNASGIAAGTVTMSKAAFPPDGFRFSGVIHRVNYTAFGAGISGGVGSEHNQVFHADGTVTDTSFTGVSGQFDTGGGFAGSTKQPEETGRYKVSGGIITVIPPEGAPLRNWIILEDADSMIVGGEPVSAMEP